MPLINCEINLVLTWSANCVILKANRAATFPTTDTNLYVLVVTLSTPNATKLLEQLKSGLKRTINCSNDQSRVSMQAQVHYLDYLIDSSFQGVTRIFVLSFENNAVRTGHTGHTFFPKLEINKCNIMIDCCKFFVQPVKNDLRTNGNSRKIAGVQRKIR